MISPKLLTVYLRAAAREASDGKELSKRSQWAIAEARSELDAYRDVLGGRPPSVSLGYSLAVAQPARSRASRRIADLFMTHSDIDAEREGAAAERCIATAIADLEDLEQGNAAAAGRILRVVSQPPGPAV